MNVSDIIQELQNHGFQDTTTQQLMYVINDTIWDIDGREAWPYLIKSLSLNFSGASATPTNMPADFKAVQWIADTTTGEGVWPERLETIRDKFASNLTIVDVPLVFYFVGQTLKFYPTPASSTGRYLMDYFAVQTTLLSTDVEASILMPPRHHRAIVLGALYKLYMLEDDPELSSGFKLEYEDRLQDMKNDLFKKQYMQPDRIFVIDEDDNLDSYYPTIY